MFREKEEEYKGRRLQSLTGSSSEQVPEQKNGQAAFESAEENKECRMENPEIKKKSTKKYLWAVILFLSVLLIYAGASLFVSYGNRVLPGISVLGVDMSWLTKTEAEEKWQKESADLYESNGIRFLDQGEEIGFESLANLGVHYEATEAVDRAWEIGHSEKIYLQGYTFIRALFEKENVVPRTVLDESKLENETKKLANTVGCTFVEENYYFDQGNSGNEPGLYITKGKTGRKMNEEWLRTTIQSKVENGDLSPVECEFDEKEFNALNLQTLHDEIAGHVAEATYDKQTGEVTFATPGCEFDVEEVTKQYEEEAPGETFLVNAEVTFPKATTEEVKEGLFRDVIGTVTTKIGGSSVRIGNVKQAAKNINGKIYNPGEVFWYNATVGERTTERGFGAAPAYLAGKTVMEVGGGICQVSSTLYFAVLKANLQIVDRSAHAYIPDYIQAGCDATVSWGGPDFAFRNSTNYPIKITTSVNENNELTVSIIGTKVDDTYVEIETRWLSKTDYTTIYQTDASLSSGETVVEQTPYTGYHVVTYRNLYAGDGTLISSIFESDSDYQKRDKIVRCALDYNTAEN